MRILAAMVMLVACYEPPDYADTRFRCGDNNRCPAGYSCSHGVCQPGVPTDGSVDGTIALGIMCGSTRCAVGDVCCANLGTATCKPPGVGPCSRTATCDATSANCGTFDTCCQTPSGADCIPWVDCPSNYVCAGPGDDTCWNTPNCCTSSDGPWLVCGSC